MVMDTSHNTSRIVFNLHWRLSKNVSTAIELAISNRDGLAWVLDKKLGLVCTRNAIDDSKLQLRTSAAIQKGGTTSLASDWILAGCCLDED